MFFSEVSVSKMHKTTGIVGGALYVTAICHVVRKLRGKVALFPWGRYNLVIPHYPPLCIYPPLLNTSTILVPRILFNYPSGNFRLGIEQAIAFSIDLDLSLLIPIEQT